MSQQADYNQVGLAVANLRRMLSPQSVAVIGASDTPAKVGFTLFQNLVRGGFAGQLFAVNKSHSLVQGQRAFPRIGELPISPDLAIVCTPAATVPQIIQECGDKGVAGVLVLTAGFREIGPAGLALEQQLVAQQKRYPGMRVMGPNCLGLICPWERLNASFGTGLPNRGSVAFLSQSGALCTAVLDWAITQQVGFSHFVSLGNQVDVGFAHLLELLADDPRTTSAILYVESISNAEHFLKAARSFARHKPIVAAKSGRFTASAKAAASHTGAMAGVDAVYEAAFRRAGIVRVFDMESMFECVELLTQHPQTVGPRLAIVTNAGGPGVMATDALLASRGQLAELSSDTLQQLNEFLPKAWSHGNPVDVLGDADADRFVKAMEVVLRDDNVDTILAVLTPQAMTEPTQTAKRVAELVCPAGKTVIASWMGGQRMQDGRHFLRGGRIPEFETPEQAINGLMHLSNYSRARVALQTEEDHSAATVHQNTASAKGASQVESTTLSTALKAASTASQERVQHILQGALDGQPTKILSQLDSKRILAEYGIPVTRIAFCPSSSEAISAAQSIGYPVVAKIQSQQITHKTEVAGVVLNLQNADEVQQAFDRLVANAQRLRPDAQIDGITLEPMISFVHSLELILGAKRDPIFGPVLMVGYGGIAAELFNDRVLELPPLTDQLAGQMLRSLRCWPLLNGYRGRAKVDVDKLCATIVRLSNLVSDQPQIQEVDINPLMVSAQSIIALDARIVVV